MKKAVCIIDDDDDVRDVVAFALENDGFDVLSFENPKLAIKSLLELAPADYPGLIIVDYFMPEMDGVSFINLIQAEHKDSLGRIQIAFSSARDANDTPVELPEGIIHLNKPMELDDLLKVAKNYCSL